MHRQDGIKINAATYHGVPSTWWRFKRAKREDGQVFSTLVLTCCFFVSELTPLYRTRDYYHLTSVYNGQVLDVVDGSSGAMCHSQNHVAGYDQHCWELVTPAVGFPPGWFHIQNSSTGNLLSHTYLHNPPVLLPAPDSPKASQYLEGWQFQWAAYHPKFWDSDTTSAKNLWVIVNRLTRAVLINKGWEIEDTPLGSIVAWPPNNGWLWPDAKWKLELDTSCNWKIINSLTSCFLEQTQVQKGSGMEVVCVDKRFTTKGGNKSWILRYVHTSNLLLVAFSRVWQSLMKFHRPPVLETDDEVGTLPVSPSFTFVSGHIS